MPQRVNLAGVTWDAAPPASRAVRRLSVSPAPASNARGHGFRRAAAFAGRDASRPRVTTGKRPLSPRVFAGIVRATEFALVAGIGSAIAYFYVADLFLQYASALALAGFASVTVFQS